jgi:hypothetical protein
MLRRQIQIIRINKHDALVLKVDGTSRMIEHADASFAVHEELLSYTGGRTKYN